MALPCGVCILLPNYVLRNEHLFKNFNLYVSLCALLVLL